MRCLSLISVCHDNVIFILRHISYSLAWSDRTFPDKNGGHTFPARFDNRHTVNVLLNCHVSDRMSLNAVWTGHSGNRFTLLPQAWESPDFGTTYAGLRHDLCR